MEIDYANIITQIYTNIFLKEVDTSVNVFLCGASTASKDTIRDKIFNKIKPDSRFNVVFPEWLFAGLLGKKGYNLLELENLLAENVDVIVIPIEGMGTYAEIGAFATQKGLREKIIIINNIEFKEKKSFINLGPIGLIKQENKNNLIFYKTDFTNTDLDNVIKRMKSLRIKSSKYELNNIFNLSRFINYLIAIFQPIEFEKITNLLSFLKFKVQDEFIWSCIEILIRKGKIYKDTELKEGKKVGFYYLSKEGHQYIYEDLLSRLHLIKIFCHIRAKILNYQNRKLNLFHLKEGQVNF